MRDAKRADILIVDDLPEKHLTYRVALEALDQNIVAVTSGEEALQLLLEHEFAVILLDVNMPGMSGLETAALIRQRRKSRAHAHHLRHRLCRRRANGRRLCAGRGRLHPDADRARDPAGQGQGVRRALPACAPSSRDRMRCWSSAWRTVRPSSNRPAEQLRTEVHERKQAEERLTILVQELAHRVKNLLSVFQSITARTLTDGRTILDAREVLIGRLQSLGHAHELLTEASWHGAELRDVVMAEIAGFSERVRVSGPSVELSPSGVQTFALIVHELCTNAAKYGALSNADRRGRRELDALRAAAAGGHMDFSWKEHGGPPVAAASHEGFGLSLITAMGSNPTAEPVIDFAPGGFACTIRVPLDTIRPSRYDKALPDACTAVRTQARTARVKGTAC